MLSGTAPLVGRAQVLAELDVLLTDARAGRGGLVLVTGEAGIGKTRIAEELVRRAGGFAAHWAWCRCEQSAGSLRTWSTVLRALAASEAAVSELATESRALHSLIAGTAEGGAPHPEISRSVLAQDVAHALQLAGRTPRLVILDDLHDAEPSTLRLLVDVSAELRGTSVLVVATARDTGWDGREPLRAELLRQARRIPLQPLGIDEIAELLGPEQQGRVDRLAARTGGNPLLVTELARSVEEVPTSLRALVAARAGAADETSRDVLAAAAVLGPQFRLDVLADVTGLPLGEIGQHLVDDLITTAGSGEARFTHELLRDAVYEDLDAGSRQRWHARAGEVLDQLRTRGRMVVCAEVAHHLLLAGPGHAMEAVARCLDAAASALNLQAFDDAVRWYTQALDLLDDPAERAAVVIPLARARRATGDRTGARTDLLEAGRLALQADRADLLTRAALALGTGPGGFEVDLQDAGQLDLLEAALRILPACELALRATVLGRLSVARSLVDSPQLRLATATEAVSLARASGDPVALAGALAGHCDAIAGPDCVAQRLAQSSEVVDLAVGLRDGDLELLGRRLRLVALLELGDRDAAEREALAYQLRADEVGHPLYRWYVPLWRGMWALAEGRYDDCLAANAEVERIGAGSDNAQILAISQRFVLNEQLGESGMAANLLMAHGLEQYGGVWPSIAMALIHSDRGDLAQARARLDSVGDLLGRLPKDSEWLASLAQATLVVSRLGDHPLRDPLYSALLPHAELMVVEGIGAAVRGPVRTFLAMLAPDEATAGQHRARAEELLRAFGASGLLAATATPAPGPCLTREGDVWAVCFEGRHVRVKDSKGMRDLVTLLGQPGREIPALDLYGGPTEHDTGEVLDATARAAYKLRLAELEEQESLSEAEAVERQFLLEQLSSAYGLGGNVRRLGSSAEKARSTVTARVRDTLKRIAAHDPALGRHLSHSVRTGTFCSYAPETPVMWHLTP